MLINAKSLKGYKFDSKDGEVGKVKELFFDDLHWAVRYLVADTGNWFTGNEVLISPYAILSIDKEAELIRTDLTRQQIENSPSWDRDRPVSRQYEESFYGYYGYPMYWGGSFMWGAFPYITRDVNEWKTSVKGEYSGDPHLRSTKDVSGHTIQALDGDIGHVDDFVIDDETWAIRYLIIDTKNWWPGKKVLVSPLWIDRLSWAELKVFVNLTRESIKQSPEYSDQALLTRDYETELHRHYNREGYWSEAERYHAH
jgi:stress response protein YsnF